MNSSDSSPPSQPSLLTQEEGSSPALPNPPNEGPTALQLGIAAVVLATSAGFTLYSRKADAMLRRMEQITENQMRRSPPKFGPPTKLQSEKMRTRIDNDDFF